MAELKYATRGMLGKEILETKAPNSSLKLEITKLADISLEAFEIKTIKNQIVISGNTPKGVLYGVFELIRKMQLAESLENINVASSPKIQLRMLNHWDNNNGTIERGSAGMSMWKWYELPERIDPRYIDYARANASITPRKAFW